MAEIHIGTQGWNYDVWTGPFYPRGTRAADYLNLYGRIFDTVEVDSTFYAIPSEASITAWRERAPHGFTYALKLPRQITHENRLHQSEEILAQFCARVRDLGNKLAAILIQMPPDFSPRALPALERFVALLPTDLPFALEVRDATWLTEEREGLLALLSAHGVALALVDSKWIPRSLSFELVERPTADFGYVRWMGRRELTDFTRVQIEREPELRQWADALARLPSRVGRVFGYFNNHYQGHSPASSNQFKTLLQQPTVDPKTLVAQPSLFG